MGEITESPLHTVEALHHAHLRGVKSTVDRIVQCIGAVADTLLDALDTAGDVLQSEALIDVCSRCDAVQHRGTSAAKSTKSKTTAAEEHGENDHGPQALAKAAPSAVVVFAVRLTGKITGHHFIVFCHFCFSFSGYSHPRAVRSRSCLVHARFLSRSAKLKKRNALFSFY